MIRDDQGDLVNYTLYPQAKSEKPATLVLSKTVLTDERLPLAVVGMWARGISWAHHEGLLGIVPFNLAARFKLSLPTVRKYVEILIQYGYAKKKFEENVEVISFINKF